MQYSFMAVSQGGGVETAAGLLLHPIVKVNEQKKVTKTNVLMVSPLMVSLLTSYIDKRSFKK